MQEGGLSGFYGRATAAPTSPPNTWTMHRKPSIIAVRASHGNPSVHTAEGRYRQPSNWPATIATNRQSGPPGLRFPRNPEVSPQASDWDLGSAPDDRFARPAREHGELVQRYLPAGSSGTGSREGWLSNRRHDHTGAAPAMPIGLRCDSALRAMHLHVETIGL